MTTATERYETQRGEVDSRLSYIQALLSQHRPDTPSYGHAGDLGYVSEQLDIIIEFLGGNVKAPAPNKFWTNTGDGYRAVTVPEE